MLSSTVFLPPRSERHPSPLRSPTETSKTSAPWSTVVTEWPILLVHIILLISFEFLFIHIFSLRYWFDSSSHSHLFQEQESYRRSARSCGEVERFPCSCPSVFSVIFKIYSWFFFFFFYIVSVLKARFTFQAAIKIRCGLILPQINPSPLLTARSLSRSFFSLN